MNVQHTFGNNNESYDVTMYNEIARAIIMGKMTMPQAFTKKEIIQDDIVEPEDNIIQITGTINDNDSLTLPGVKIIVKGTNNGTQKDFDGNYVIDASMNSVLIITYVGFDTQ